MANSKPSVYAEDESTTKAPFQNSIDYEDSLPLRMPRQNGSPMENFTPTPFGPTHQAHAIHFHYGGFLYKYLKGCASIVDSTKFP
jgi:hypothetical protein